MFITKFPIKKFLIVISAEDTIRELQLPKFYQLSLVDRTLTIWGVFKE